MALYLGLDASTQSLAALIVRVEDGAPPNADRSADRSVIFEHSISFDEALPGYVTRHGVLPSENASVAVSSPLMWAEALELMMAEIAGWRAEPLQVIVSSSKTGSGRQQVLGEITRVMEG